MWLFFFSFSCLFVGVCVFCGGFFDGGEMYTCIYLISVRCEFAKGRNPLVVALCVTMQAKATDNVLIFTNSCIFISLLHSYYLHSPIDGFTLLTLSLILLCSNCLPWLIPQKKMYKNCAVKAQPQSNLDIDFFIFIPIYLFSHTNTFRWRMV